MRQSVHSPDDITLDGWPEGVNNVRSLTDLGRRALRAGVNVDIPVSGRPRRRHGYASVQAGNAHSLWAPEGWPYALLVIDGQLCKLEAAGDAETVTPLLASPTSNRWRYCVQNDAVHASNGVDTARIDMAGALSAWGVDAPSGQPLVAAPAGLGLDAGRYQVAVTFVAPDGEESGTGRAANVAVPQDGGIALSAIPQPLSGTGSIRVYCSPPDGDALYHVATVPAGTLAHTITRSQPPGRMLETQFCDRVPPSSFLCSYRGRIYFAIGDTLYYTLALRFGLFRVHQGYFRFPHRITGVAAVADGLYVGTQRMAYFLAGSDPKDMTQRPVDAFGVVENTLQALRGATFGVPVSSQELAAVWWSANGLLLRGGASGAVTPITKGRLALPSFATGSLLHREQDQVQQLVSVLRSAEHGSPLAARDAATVSVVRNGVVIN
jgi:hypothetical protein